MHSHIQVEIVTGMKRKERETNAIPPTYTHQAHLAADAIVSRSDTISADEDGVADECEQPPSKLAKSDHTATQSSTSSPPASSSTSSSSSANVDATTVDQLIDLNKPDLLHVRNIYRSSPPNFVSLAHQHPEFAKFVTVVGTNPQSQYGVLNWRDPEAVLALTRVLLKHDFHIDFDMPLTNLCPPVPQRLNYIHWVADLLQVPYSTDQQRHTPVSDIRGFDVGTGASCIFPLLGYASYGWKFIASDVDPDSIRSARSNISRNSLESHIEVRLNPDRSHILLGVLQPGEKCDFMMCNPPFFTTMADTGLNPNRATAATSSELVCPGGEESFISTMIRESKSRPSQIKWCTTMLGRKASLKTLMALLRSDEIQALVVDTTEFNQGQQTRWGLAWTFDVEERRKREALVRKNSSFTAAASENNAKISAANSSPVPSSSSVSVPSTSVSPSSVPPLPAVQPKQKLKFMVKLQSATPVELMQFTREKIQSYAQTQSWLCVITQVSDFHWKISANRAAAMDGSVSSSLSSELLFSCEMMLLQHTASEMMIDLQWRKPASTPSMTDSVIQTSKVLFTSLGLHLQEVCKNWR